MADSRTKAVWGRLAPLFAESNYAIDLATTSLREPLGLSDAIEVPSIAELTINASGSVGASPEAVTTSVLTLNANLEPFINALLPKLSSLQNLGNGEWASQTAEQCVSMIKNSMDEALLLYLIERNWTDDATPLYTVNPASDSLTTEDLLTAIATLTANRGTTESDLVFMMSPFGRASLSNITGFVPNMAGPSIVNGLPMVGTVYSIPVYATSSAPDGRETASSAFVDDGTDTTITVASDSMVVGQPVSFTTATSANDFSSKLITSVAAGAITVASATGAAATETEVGAVTLEASESLLIDKNSTYVAMQEFPSTRIVPISTSSSDALQVSSVWGRVSRIGRAMVICSPKSAV